MTEEIEEIEMSKEIGEMVEEFDVAAFQAAVAGAVAAQSGCVRDPLLLEGQKYYATQIDKAPSAGAMGEHVKRIAWMVAREAKKVGATRFNTFAAKAEDGGDHWRVSVLFQFA